MSYLDQEKFDDKPKALVFNNGKAGVVIGCKVTVERKGENDNENAPDYKLFAWDTEQTVNSDDSISVYPVNKGFYYSSGFKSPAAEKYAVNELKHLLKTFGHEINENDQLDYKRDIKDYNDFLDYAFIFIKESLSANKGQMFDIVVDYGNGNFPSDFLRLNGYPWYIGVPGSKLNNKNDAIMERPVKDSEKDSSSSDDSSEGSGFWED